MKFCQTCGSEVNEDAVVCLSCGCSVSNKSVGSTEEKNNIAIAAIILAFLIPVLGLILGGVALFNSVKKNAPLKGLAIASIVVSILVMLFNYFILGAILEDLLNSFM